jgi:hypothetical protein
MHVRRPLALATALAALVLAPATVVAETFDLIFYGRVGSATVLQRLSQYPLVFTGTFTIDDTALGRPGALILYRDGAFLGFDVTIQTASRAYNFNLSDSNDKFPGDQYPVNAVTRTDPLQGLRLDASGRPQRFDTPITAAGDSANIREFNFAAPTPYLGLFDSDDFDVVVRNDGVLVVNSRGGAAGTRVAGFWSFGGHARTGDATTLGGIYLIRSRGTSTPPPAPTPGPAPSPTLGAPAGLTAQVSGLSVLLSWQPSPGAASYVLEAGTSAGTSNAFVGDVGNTTSLQTQGPAGTYFVRVKARNGSLTSAPSNEVSVTLGAAGPCGAPPPAPSGLAQSRIGSLLRLNWGGVPGAASYQLEAGTASGLSNAFNGDVGASPGQQFDISGVPAGSYFVRVRAKNGCGTSSPSGEIVVTVS